jgi:hypothetical protein
MLGRACQAAGGHCGWGALGKEVGHAACGSGGDCRCSASCDAAGEWAIVPSGQRRGSEGLSGFAAAGGANAGVVSGRLLPDVEPRASHSDPAPSGGPGRDVPPSAWALRLVLEPCARLLRTCLAGAILFLSHGSGPFVDGSALCGTESGARRHGGGGGGLAVVERRGALRNGPSGRLPGHVNVEPELVCGCLAKVPGGRRIRLRAASYSPLYANRPTTGVAGVHAGAGRTHSTPPDARQTRAPAETARGICPAMTPKR